MDFLPSVVSYWSDIREDNDISCICRGSGVQRRCIRCFVSMIDIQDMKTGQVRTITKTKEVLVRGKHILPPQKSLENIEYPDKELAVKNPSNVPLGQLSLAQCKSFLKNANIFEEGAESGLYHIFNFEPLHNFQL